MMDSCCASIGYQMDDDVSMEIDGCFKSQWLPNEKDKVWMNKQK